MNSYNLIIDRAIEECPKVQISNNTWNYPYAPKMEAQMTYIRDKGIVVRLTCFEKDPFTRYTLPHDPVYTDSCMECFFNLCPEKSKDYINLETNSNGAFILSYGPGRGDVRTHIFPTLGLKPEINVTKTDECWIVDAVIGNEILHAVYGEFELKSGDSFTGNFYKCGQDGDNPHFITWNEVDTPKPDFHRPEFFGKIIVE